MAAVLTWFTSFFLSEAAKVAFQKLAMIVAFNIALAFLVEWVGTHVFAGLTMFGTGDAATGLLGSLPSMVLFFLDYMNAIVGGFMILNAYLFRFAFRLQLAALGASR